MTEDSAAAARAVESAYDAAWGRGDVDGLLACLTDDAVLVSPRGEVARGRAEIAAVLGGILAGWAAGSTHAGEVLRVEVLTDDVVVLDGRARVTGVAADAPGADADGTLVHDFTDVLVRRDGRWRIAHVRAHAAR